MIRLVALELPEVASNQLAAWQQAITALPTYQERVAQAREQFSARNKTGNPVFRAVRGQLAAMCCGERRCAYCEDSCADEIEHVRPKALFPEEVFAWRNYIYACGPCNGIKRDNFPRLVGGVVRNVARGPKDPIVEPPQGVDLLLDPRVDEPAEVLMLDLSTGFILPRRSLDPLQRQRAEQTIEVLRLNRPGLMRARMREHRNYIARLARYIRMRDEDELADLDADVEDICRMGHPMVWNEIRRQQINHPGLHRLFVQAPEALAWAPRPHGAVD
ncbi:hypothetical protein [Nannocystis pusilla]|uniref:TIGR02646 family protein n=1 Tax=Nannocystis pusilla TaxID=889268 RepID=A0ABS7U1L9_9BACT|nr:hypothetical protein [Nannocystis pusilla]MBZ5714434.1 hypothetical protein [Nannocystis pusilla]